MQNCTQKTPKRLNMPGVVISAAISNKGIHILFAGLVHYSFLFQPFSHRLMLEQTLRRKKRSALYTAA